MSIREEEQRKNNCPSRGLGLAAAAIGVGVGAALYYFFSKRPENPDVVGSTSEEWSVEQPRSFNDSNASKSYTTISEHSTTDTSINEDDEPEYRSCKCNGNYRDRDSSTEFSDMMIDSDESIIDISDSNEMDEFSTTDSDSIYSSEDVQLESGYSRTTIDSIMNGNSDVYSDTEMSEWDITNSSLGVPNNESTATNSPLQRLFSHISSFVGNADSDRCQITTEDDQMRILREQAFRERSWSLEECSICFEVMLKDQPLLALPCTHNFHVACIGPWLEEQRTCPVCRKAAE